MNINQQLFDKCVEVAATAIRERGHRLNAESQVSNIFAYGASDKDFEQVLSSEVSSPTGIELIAQVKYICELGLDTAKGKKLVYVKTRGFNIGTREKPRWIKYPDIQESYHALIMLLIQSGLVKNINVIHTYENYPIEYTGSVSDIPVVRAWEVGPSERGSYTGCFVVITFNDGTVQTSYHHLKDILDTHKSFSKSGNTWAKHLQAMVAKSAILDATRYIPKLDTVVASVVERYDNNHNWEEKINEEKITEKQASQLVNLMAEHGCAESDVLKEFGIPDLESLPASKFNACGFMITGGNKK